MPTALITGISGQDGRLLAALLLEKGYRVVGVTRDAAAAAGSRCMPRHSDLQLVESPSGANLDIAAILDVHRPDEVYNLASQSSPELSWSQALETGDASGLSAHRLFEAVRRAKLPCRIYQASSSEMFGDATITPQDEDTPFGPLSPYAAAKVYAHHVARIYREALGLFVCCGILFNHESTLRGMNYLTQRIALGAACASLGIAESPQRNADGTPIVTGGKLLLGNLEAKRDWGAAADYVRAMWLMLQRSVPGDFVIGTGKLRSVADLCDIAYRGIGRDWTQHVRSDVRQLRPADTGARLADARRARDALGWSPAITIESVLAEMIAFHVQALQTQ